MNQRQTGSVGDELTNAALIGLIGLVGIALVLRAAASVTAYLTGLPQPDAGPAAGLAVLFNPTDPATALGVAGLNPAAYWLVSAGILAVLTTVAVRLWIAWRRHTHKAETDPHHLAGIATRHDVQTTASTKALLRRAGTLRPSLDSPTPADIGYLLGTSHGTKAWASVEDSILLIGPPRSGKGLHIVINAILDAPGAVVTTSTRPDNLTATLHARQRHGGPVAVFDPQHLAEGIPAGLRWSPVRGCHDPLTAMIRANGLAAATGLSAGGVESGGFWEGKTRTALQSLLHAAALDDRPPAELFRWTLDPAAASEAVAILNSHPNAAIGWDDSLAAMIDADPKPATAFGKESPLPSPPWPTPESPTQSPPNPTSSSTPRSSSPNTEPSTSSPPAQVPAHPLPWSPHSSRTSWKPPADLPPAHPEHGSTRPCCSPSTRSGTSHPSHRYPC